MSRFPKYFAQTALAGLFLSSCNAVVSDHQPQPETLQAKEAVYGVSYFLPKQLLKLTAKVGGAAGVENVTLDYVTIPDRRLNFQLSYQESATSADHLIVEVAKSGLLKKVSAEVNERSDIILQNVVDIAAILASGAPGIGGDLGAIDQRSIAKSGRASEADGTFTINYTFDPFDAAESRAAHKVFSKYNICVTVEVERLSAWTNTCQGPEATAEDIAEQVLTDRKETSSGIYFRRPEHYLVTAYVPGKTSSTQAKFLASKRIPFANMAPLRQINIKRTVFTRRKTEIQFDIAGAKPTYQPSKVIYDKESGLKNASAIPLRIAKAIVAVPASILTVRTDYNTALAGLYGKQRSLLQKQRQFQEFLASRSSGGGSQPEDGGTKSAFAIEQKRQRDAELREQQETAAVREARFQRQLQDCLNSGPFSGLPDAEQRCAKAIENAL